MDGLLNISIRHGFIDGLSFTDSSRKGEGERGDSLHVYHVEKRERLC
jgi:hypothetical protein